MAIEGFAVFEFDEHGVALGGGEEAEGKLWGAEMSAEKVELARGE